MKFAWIALFGLMAATAQAGVVTGRSTLMLTQVGGPNSYFVEVRIEDGRLVGHSSFGTGMVNVEKDRDGTLVGYVGTGRVNFRCFQDSCGGLLNNGMSKMAMTDLGNGGFKLEGRLGWSYANVTRTDDKIEITSDGSLFLTRQADGTFAGSGSIGRGMNGQVSATLTGEGELAELRDPALLTVILAAPFVRNR